MKDLDILKIKLQQRRIHIQENKLYTDNIGGYLNNEIDIMQNEIRKLQHLHDIEPKWLIQTNIFKETEVDRMICNVTKLGYPFELITIIPFSDTLTFNFYDGPVIAYGTTTLMRNVKKNKHLFPGMWFDEEKFKPSYWGSKLKEYYLNWDAKIVKLKDVIDEFKTNFQKLFIRPNSDFKLFSGDVFYKYEFEQWLENICWEIDRGTYHLLNLDTEISVAPYRSILKEYRFVIVDGKVITGSIYKVNGLLNLSNCDCCIDSNLSNFIKMIAEHEFQVAPVYVADIAMTTDGYKLIEINCFNASGLYACDSQKIINAVSIFAKKQYFEKNI